MYQVGINKGIEVLINHEVNNAVSKGKGKAVPLQALTGPDDPRSLRLPDFKTIDTRSLSAVRTGHRLSSRMYFWYSFLLEVESTPGP